MLTRRRRRRQRSTCPQQSAWTPRHYHKAKLGKGGRRVSPPTRRASSAPLTLRVKLRRSVAIAIAITIPAPIETVVDPYLHHLDVAVPHKKSVSGEAL